MSTPAYGGKIAALEPKNLARLFLTHLHFDHTEGLSEFMLAPWIYFREGPLQVYGPPGTEDVVRHLTEAYTKDIDLQMFDLEELNSTGYILKAKDVLPGEVYNDKNIRITAFQNHHGTWDYTYGYRVVTSKPDGTVDRTIVLSGDTSLFDGMEEDYAGADILFHEAYSFDPKTNPYDAKAPVSVSYMNAFSYFDRTAGRRSQEGESQGHRSVSLRNIHALECDRPGARCQGDQVVWLQRSCNSVTGRRHFLAGAEPHADDSNQLSTADFRSRPFWDLSEVPVELTKRGMVDMASGPSTKPIDQYTPLIQPRRVVPTLRRVKHLKLDGSKNLVDRQHF